MPGNIFVTSIPINEIRPFLLLLLLSNKERKKEIRMENFHTARRYVEICIGVLWFFELPCYRACYFHATHCDAIGYSVTNRVTRFVTACYRLTEADV